MDFQDKFARVLCSLFSVLQVSFSHMSDLLSQEGKIPREFRIAEINPEFQSRLRSYESVQFYNSTNSTFKSVVSRKRTREKISGFENKKQPDLIKTKNSSWETGNEEFEKRNGDQQRQSHEYSPQISVVTKKINDVRVQIKKLQMVSELLKDAEAELRNIEKFLPVDSFEKMASGEKMKISDRNGVKEMNNVINNNQYLVGNIFIINRLSEENNSSLKETEVEILKELTDRKMKELLEKAVNNLNGDGIGKGDVPAVTQISQYEMDLLKQLQENFSKMFNNQNLTLEHVNQMSKIIDFVERYHGTVVELGSSLLHDRMGNVEGAVENLKEIYYDDDNVGKKKKESEKKVEFSQVMTEKIIG